MSQVLPPSPGHGSLTSPPVTAEVGRMSNIPLAIPGLCFTKSLASRWQQELLRCHRQCPQTCPAPPRRQDWELLCNSCPGAALAAAGGSTGSGQGRAAKAWELHSLILARAALDFSVCWGARSTELLCSDVRARLLLLFCSFVSPACPGIRANLTPRLWRC